MVRFVALWGVLLIASGCMTRDFTNQQTSEDQSLSDVIPDFIERWYSGSKLMFPSRMLTGLRIESVHVSLQDQGSPELNLNTFKKICADYDMTAREGWTFEQLSPLENQAAGIDFAAFAPERRFVPLKLMMVRKYKNLKERMKQEHAEVIDVGISYRPGQQKFVENLSLAEINEGNAITTSAASGGSVPVVSNAWHIDSLRARGAWKLLRNKKKGLGSGVQLAILDTGFVAHPENLPLNEEELKQRVIIGKNFLREEQNAAAEDRFSLRSRSANSHCSGAISVVVSPEGRSPRNPSRGDVVGVAPEVTVRYSRVSPTFVGINSTQIVRGIYEAVSQKVDVINLSLGTFHSPALRNAIQYAVSKGVIVVCAGGQFVDAVPSPGNSPGCIAATAIDKNDRVWEKSAVGNEIAIAAPGVDIWHSQTVMHLNRPHEYKIASASGTTFSSTLVAGVASLWLSYWGKDFLVEKYGSSKISAVFHSLLRSTARVPMEWKVNQHGAGIVDAEALLKAPLPD